MKVNCPACNRSQEDEGKRNACRYCGTQPVPSYAYPTSSAFHPDHVLKPKNERGPSINQIYKEIKKRRAARAK